MSSSDATSAALSAVARHHAETTAPMAAAAHTTIVNALSVPSVESMHDHARASVDVVIADPEGFEKKRAAMIAAGAQRLQIVSDFDRTLSAFLTSTGAMCAASHQLLESCVGFNNATFLPEMDRINQKYFALEISHDITEEQRAEYMLEWWHQAHDLLLKQNIRHQSIADAVRTSRESKNLELRKGAKEFLHLLNAADIPCLIFSAGLKETIRQTLEQERLLLPCCHLIGNEMHFGEDGVLKAFGSDTITSSNKNYSHVKCQEPQFLEKSAMRKQVILLGDNIGDAHMARGMEGIETCIKIGLLHDNVEGRLEQFKSAFDVVLLNDADFSFAHRFVQEIISGKPAQAAPEANGTAAQ